VDRPLCPSGKSLNRCNFPRFAQPSGIHRTRNLPSLGSCHHYPEKLHRGLRHTNSFQVDRLGNATDKSTTALLTEEFFSERVVASNMATAACHYLNAMN